VSLVAGYQIKGALVRSYRRQVERLGIFDEAVPRTSAESQALLRDPPIASSWLDAAVIEELIGAVEALRGMEAVRTVTREGQLSGVVQTLRPVIGGMLRLFGATPMTLFTRFAQITSSNVRGLELGFNAETERAGSLRVRFPRKQVPLSAYVGFESGLGNILDVCATPGRVEPAKLSSDGSIGTIRVSW
jgi:hypothetical protein